MRRKLAVTGKIGVRLIVHFITDCWRRPAECLSASISRQRLKASVQPDRRVRRDLGFEPTVDGPDHGDHPSLYFEMSAVSAQIPYSAVNGETTDSK